MGSQYEQDHVHKLKMRMDKMIHLPHPFEPIPIHRLGYAAPSPIHKLPNLTRWSNGTTGPVEQCLWAKREDQAQKL